MSSSRDLLVASVRKDLPVATFRTDYNIVEYHRIVLANLRSQDPMKVEEEIMNIKKELKSGRFTKVTIRAMQNKIKALEKKLEKIRSAEEGYLADVLPLLEEYVSLQRAPKIAIFGEELPEDDFDEHAERRCMVVEKYFRKTEKYVPVYVTRENISDNVCACGGEMIEQNDITFCGKCGTKGSSICHIPRYSDATHMPVSVTPGGRGDPIEAFNEVIIRFQGKQQNKLPNDLFQRLDAYFISKKNDVGEVVKTKPMETERRREGTTKVMMQEALVAIGQTDLYKDINLVCHLYWGWTLPDISAYEQLCKEKYRILNDLYNVYKTTDEFKAKYKRKSHPNAHVFLRNILEWSGYRTIDDDFKELKTPDTIEFHIDLLTTLAKQAGWEVCQPIV